MKRGGKSKNKQDRSKASKLAFFDSITSDYRMLFPGSRFSHLERQEGGKQKDGQVPAQLLRNGSKKPNSFHLISLTDYLGWPELAIMGSAVAGKDFPGKTNQ